MAVTLTVEVSRSSTAAMALTEALIAAVTDNLGERGRRQIERSRPWTPSVDQRIDHPLELLRQATAEAMLAIRPATVFRAVSQT